MLKIAKFKKKKNETTKKALSLFAIIELIIIEKNDREIAQAHRF
jgi:hypothetical protein